MLSLRQLCVRNKRLKRITLYLQVFIRECFSIQYTGVPIKFIVFFSEKSKAHQFDTSNLHEILDKHVKWNLVLP